MLCPCAYETLYIVVGGVSRVPTGAVDTLTDTLTVEKETRSTQTRSQLELACPCSRPKNPTAGDR
jgi:hypothetical protein